MSGRHQNDIMTIFAISLFHPNRRPSVTIVRPILRPSYLIVGTRTMQSALGVSQGGVRIVPLNTDGGDIESSNTNNRSKIKPHASPNVGRPKPPSKRSSIASRLPVALHLHRGDRADHSGSGENGMSATSPLNSTKFDMASAITSSGFQETAACLEEISTKAAKIVEAQSCHVWMIDQTKHELYRLLPDGSAVATTSAGPTKASTAAGTGEIRLIKPLDRGITASIVSEPSGFNTKNVATSGRWSHDIDEINAGAGAAPGSSRRETISYLAWPLCDSTSGECLGVVEFRNKCNGGAFFNAADSQLARIVAIQLANAIVHYRQQELLAGRNEAINKAYEEKSYDAAETICIDDGDGNDGNTKGRPLVVPATSQQRSAFALPATANISGTTSGTPTTGSTSFHPHNSSAMSDSEPTGSMGCTLAERGWEYDTFSQTEEELIQHAISIFDERGLLARFSIPVSTLTNFLREIISGYRKETPYHNHHHCFDVLHVSYLLITRCKADEYLESLNVLSIFVAALAHDLGHDGYNNAFHAATESDLAVTYNGVSILENHSAAQLFRILKKEDCNILKRLNAEEQTKIRSRLIDLILDTDAKNHFMLCTRFKHGLEMKQLSRGLLSSMLLHIADVSNPSRPGPVARKWAFAVQAEFFRQGDKERELNLPRSPFMDREFENLPRMQAAFIDAIVMPVCKLLAEFLPHVKDQCIKSLQLNRAFWNSLSSKGILKSTDITAYLEREVTHSATIEGEGVGAGDESDDGSNSNDHTDVGDNIDGGEESSSTEPPLDMNQPIPGIPSNALQASPDARRVSLISLPHGSAHNLHGGDDPELGMNGAGGSAASKSKKRRRKGLKEQLKDCLRSIKTKMTAVLESHSFQIIMMLATIYALFASDLSLVAGNVDSDNTVDAVSFLVLVMFIGEMCSSAICIPKYMHFYFWLDLAATISLFLEIDFLLQWVSGGGGQDGNYDDGGTDQLSLAKASRAAKIGARAARLSRLLRLVRLIRVAKVVKWMLSNVIRRKNDKNLGGGTGDDDDDAAAEEVEMKMSVVGQKMTESITKKVIIAVLLTLLVFSLMDVSLVPDARQTGLDQLAVAVANNISDDGVASMILRDAFLESHSDSIIRFQGMGPDDDFVNQERFDSLRPIEMLSVYSSAMATAPNSNSTLAATFDVSHQAKISAWYSIGTTLIVTILLAALSMLLNRDAYRVSQVHSIPFHFVCCIVFERSICMHCATLQSSQSIDFSYPYLLMQSQKDHDPPDRTYAMASCTAQ